MEDIEELLAGLDAEEESAAKVEPPDKDNKVIKEIRDHAKRVERELAASRKEAEELKTWKTEQESRSKAQALSAAGLNEKQQVAFLALNQEVTPDAIQTFRSEVLGQGDSPQPESGFGPTDIAGEGATVGTFYARKDWERIMRENPAKGDEIARAGKVRWNNL
jgi:hypothetical protein